MAISETINKGLFLYNPYKIQLAKFRIRFSQLRFFLFIVYTKTSMLLFEIRKNIVEQISVLEHIW